jgi:hypothetical protein
MATNPSVAAGASVHSPARSSRNHDRAFYGGIAVVLALTVFAGFARTFYLRAFFDTPTIGGRTALTPLTQLHGALFTAWVVLFIVQTSLIRTRRVAVHQRLGLAGMGLAALMVVVGLSTAIGAAAGGFGPPGVDPRSFMIVPFTDMVLFTTFIVSAFVTRRNREAHKRLMLLAYVSILTAAIVRIPGLVGINPMIGFGISLLFVVAGMAYDRYARHRIHPVYLWGGALIAASVPARFALSSSAAWLAVADVLTR